MACVLKPVVETVALAASLGPGVLPLCALPSRGPCAGVSRMSGRLQLRGFF